MKTYWPGGGGRWTSRPTYDRRIVVVNFQNWGEAFDHHLSRAVMWWNLARADVRLVVRLSYPAEQPYPKKANSIVKDDQGPYGSYNVGGEFGFVGLVRGDGDTPTLAHELGHALGFGHTRIKSSIMSQWNTWTRDGVGKVDERGLRSYYGRR